MVRNGREEDYENVEVISKEVHLLHVNGRPDLYRNVEYALERSHFIELVKKGLILVYDEDNCVKGYASLVHRQINIPVMVSRTVLYVDSMAVKNEYRGNGIGTAMFEYIKKKAQTENYDSIELSVHAFNESARKMYEHCGFQVRTSIMELKMEC